MAEPMNITDNSAWHFRTPTELNTIYVNGSSGNNGAIYLNGENVYSLLSAVSAIHSYIPNIDGIHYHQFTIETIQGENVILIANGVPLSAIL